MNRNEVAQKLGLSKEQTKAVSLNKSSAIIAGAGSGKTTTMAASIIADLLGGTDPALICATTFTRSAASNLSEKIIEMATKLNYSGPIEKITVGTIDSILLNIMKNHSLKTNLSPLISIGSETELKKNSALAWEMAKDSLAEKYPQDFIMVSRVFGGRLEFEKVEAVLKMINKNSVYKDPDFFLEDQRKLITALEKKQKVATKKHIQENLDILIDAIENQTGPVKIDESLIRDTFRRDEPDLSERAELYLIAASSLYLEPERAAVIRCFQVYQDFYERLNYNLEIASYKDIELECLGLFERGLAKDQFISIYVDEAQDTSKSQQMAMKNLLSPEGKIIIIGDLRQSIYSWRGASPDDFSKWASELGAVELSDNYRSAKNIVSAINLISRNMDFIKTDYQDMQAVSSQKGKVSFKMLVNHKAGSGATHLASDEVEAPVIAKLVQEKIDSGANPGDICVISRTNKRVDLISRELRDLGVEVEAFFSQDPFKTKEAAAPLALLSLFADPKNEQALVRLLSSPAFFLGADEIEYLTSLDTPLIDSIKEDERLKKFRDTFFELYKNRQNYRLVERIWSILSELEYFSVIDSLDLTRSSLKTSDRIFSALEEIESRTGPVAKAILNETEFSQKTKNEYSKSDSSDDAVQVMTLYNAKGLEFPIVFYTDLGSSPTMPEKNPILIYKDKIGIRVDGVCNLDFFEGKKENNTRYIKEEERCIYVGLTRAEKELVIITRSRFSSGQIQFKNRSVESIFSHTDFSAVIDEGEISEGVVDVCFGDEVFPMDVYLPRLFEKEETLKETIKLSKTAIFDSKKDDFYRGNLSYTKLSEWKACSMRRFLENDLGLRKTDESIKFESSGARKRGIAIHKSLAQIDWKNLDANNFSKDLEKFINSEAGRLISSWPGEIFTEEKFEFQIKNQRIRGVFDVLLLSDREVVIVDWKTGQDRDQFDLQKLIYAEAGFLINKNIESVKTIWQFQDKAVSEVFKNRESLQLESAVDLIFSSRPEPIVKDKVSPICQGCPGLVQICPVSFSLQTKK